MAFRPQKINPKLNLTKSSMSMDLKYKNPSSLLKTMVNNLAADHKHYMENASVKCQAILEQAKKEGIPNEQLRKLIENAFKIAGLSDRTLRKALPQELKNQNMIRKQPKKEPLVKNWDVELDLDKFKSALQSVLDSGQKKAYVTHDNKRVIDIGLYD